MNSISIAILGITFLLLQNGVDCIKNFKKPIDAQLYKQIHYHKIKFVSYAYKSDNVMNITTVPVKNLMINPNDDWVAKALWIGDNYNTTGFVK